MEPILWGLRQKTDAALTGRIFGSRPKEGSWDLRLSMLKWNLLKHEDRASLEVALEVRESLRGEVSY
jgi:hypothetical protein